MEIKIKSFEKKVGIMKILECFVQGKNPNQKLSEDGVIVSDDFIVVVDGATAKSDRLFDGKTSGKIAMELIGKAVQSLPEKATCFEAFRILTEALAEFYIQHNIYDEMITFPYKRPTASVVIYSNFRKELWFVGDCQALVDGESLKNEKFIDFLMTEMRAYFLTTQIREGKTEEELMKKDLGREFIFPMSQKQCQFQNNFEKSKYSYAVVDGTKIPEEEIVVVNVSKAKKIVLASDGYTKLFETLSETERELERILKEDPLCFKENKGTKAILEGNLSFDDRSYISFEV